MALMTSYFSFIYILYKVALIYESADKILKCDQVLYGMLYTMVLTSESVDGILKRDHKTQNESY